MTSCLICLGPVEKGETHEKCSVQLFGTPTPPTIEVEQANLHTAALAMIGHTSISGMQGKISVKLSKDRATLQVAVEGGRYILKPDTKVYPELPANEHVTMLIARLAKIEVPPFGLIKLADNTLAYIISRFDRRNGAKLRVEDCCQLEELPPADLYQGSAEACARLVRRYASEPLIELRKLYRQFVFAWWVGNLGERFALSQLASPNEYQKKHADQRPGQPMSVFTSAAATLVVVVTSGASITNALSAASGMVASGTTASGGPASSTPASGADASGTPASGTPASGTPASGVVETTHPRGVPPCS